MFLVECEILLITFSSHYQKTMKVIILVLLCFLINSSYYNVCVYYKYLTKINLVLLFLGQQLEEEKDPNIVKLGNHLKANYN
jgi:hypothetical protein